MSYYLSKNSAKLRSSENKTRVYYAVATILFTGVLLCIPLQLSEPSLFLALLIALTLISADLRAFFIVSFPAYALFGSLFAVLLIERGAYISEQFRYGVHLGATPVLAAYGSLFLLVAHIVTARYLGKMDVVLSGDLRPMARRMVVLFCVGTGFLYSVIFALNGTGLAHEGLRFGWARDLPPALASIHSLILVFLVPAVFGLTGLIIGIYRRFQYWMLVLLIPIIVEIFVGEKFSGFTSAMFLGLEGFGIGSYIAKRPIKVSVRMILAVALIVILLLGSILIGYSRMGSTDTFSALDERITLQGHVWYGIWEVFNGIPTVPWQRVFGANSLDQPAGLDFLSYFVSDPAFVRARIALGVTFTMGGPAGLLASLGAVPGMLVFALFGLTIAFSARIVAAFAQRGAPGRVAVGLLFFVILAQTTQMGRWDTGYGTIALICYLTFVTLLLPKHKRRRSSTPFSVTNIDPEGNL